MSLNDSMTMISNHETCILPQFLIGLRMCARTDANLASPMEPPVGKLALPISSKVVDIHARYLRTGASKDLHLDTANTFCASKVIASCYKASLNAAHKDTNGLAHMPKEPQGLFRLRMRRNDSACPIQSAAPSIHSTVPVNPRNYSTASAIAFCHQSYNVASTPKVTPSDRLLSPPACLQKQNIEMPLGTIPSTLLFPTL